MVSGARTEVLRGAKWRARPNPSDRTGARAHWACSAARCSYAARDIQARTEVLRGAKWRARPNPSDGTGARAHWARSAARCFCAARDTKVRTEVLRGAKWRARPNPSERTDARAHWACSEARCSCAARERGEENYERQVAFPTHPPKKGHTTGAADLRSAARDSSQNEEISEIRSRG